MVVKLAQVTPVETGGFVFSNGQIERIVSDNYSFLRAKRYERA